MTRKSDENLGAAVEVSTEAQVAAVPGLNAQPTARVVDSYRLSRALTAMLFGLPLALLVGWIVLTIGIVNGQSRPATAAINPQPPDGAALYAQHCAMCHGTLGNGTGQAAANVWPRPRDFGEGKFRLVTTSNGIPSDDDLLADLRNGIPGSAMPKFDQLSEPELRALIEHVRELTYMGVIARLRRLADQGAIDPAEVGLVADELCKPGSQLDIPKQFSAATPDSLARGREVYAKSCASCHGPTGRGDGPQVIELKNSDGTPTRPRDLTLGRFKGGGEPAQVYARIMLGMPGSPMPANNNLPANEIQDVLNYVLSLSQNGQRTVAEVTPGR